MRKDDILLNEAYKKVHAQEPVDEAFNVTKARLAGVGGAIKGLKNRVVGGLQSGVGSMGARAAGIDRSQAPTYQSGQAKVQAGKDAGKNAKVDSILKNQTQDINKFASKLTNQLVKLGLGSTATVSDIAGGMTDKLKEILKKEAPATNQLNAGSPTPAPATPAAAPAATSEAPEEPKAEDQAATVAATPAPVASNPSQPPVQQTNTAAQAADAMKADDAGSATPEETQPEPETQPETPAAETQAETPAAETAEAPAVAVSPEQAESSAAAEAAEEEIPENEPKPKAGGPNQSIYKTKKGKTYKYVPTRIKDKKTGKIIMGRAWQDVKSKLILAPAAQEATTQMWALQQKELQQQAAQAPQQNESFRSFFWKS